MQIKWQPYWTLCKPRVVMLMLVTAVVGMSLASPKGRVPLDILLLASLGIALAAGSAATINHLVDEKIDKLMGRTKKRPLPDKQITVKKAIGFASLLAILSAFILFYFVNTLTAVLSLFTLFGYAIIYSVFLKHATPQNIVIGGITGAFPPLLGWVAVRNSIDAHALLLVLIIYLWTPPHFWALALFRLEDYKRANVPMLPVTHGVAFTKKSILLYLLLLFSASILPYAIKMSGVLYLGTAVLLNLYFCYQGIRLYFSDDLRMGRTVFRFSILYLFILFTALLLDHSLR